MASRQHGKAGTGAQQSSIKSGPSISIGTSTLGQTAAGSDSWRTAIALHGLDHDPLQRRPGIRRIPLLPRLHQRCAHACLLQQACPAHQGQAQFKQSCVLRDEGEHLL